MRLRLPLRAVPEWVFFIKNQATYFDDYMAFPLIGGISLVIFLVTNIAVFECDQRRCSARFTSFPGIWAAVPRRFHGLPPFPQDVPDAGRHFSAGLGSALGLCCLLQADYVWTAVLGHRHAAAGGSNGRFCTAPVSWSEMLPPPDCFRAW